MKELVIVVPIYKCIDCLDKLVQEICEKTEPLKINYNIILVDDGSPDNSWIKIKELRKKYDKIIGIKLSRNFGQHMAILAGLESVEADKYIIMDCDLQHNPGYIPILFKKIKNQDDDIIFTFGKRNHSNLKLFFSKLFYYLIRILMKNDEEKISHELQNFVIFSKKIRDEYIKNKFRQKHLLFVLRSLGYKKSYFEIIHNNRYAGKSSYTIISLLLHAISGVFIDLKKFSQIVVIVGLILFLIFISLGIYLFLLYFIKGFLSGWLSIIFSLISLSSIICLIGGFLLIGISQILDEIRVRPFYNIEDTLD